MLFCSPTSLSYLKSLFTKTTKEERRSFLHPSNQILKERFSWWNTDLKFQEPPHCQSKHTQTSIHSEGNQNIRYKYSFYRLYLISNGGMQLIVGRRQSELVVFETEFRGWRVHGAEWSVSSSPAKAAAWIGLIKHAICAMHRVCEGKPWCHIFGWKRKRRRRRRPALFF